MYLPKEAFSSLKTAGRISAHLREHYPNRFIMTVPSQYGLIVTVSAQLDPERVCERVVKYFKEQGEFVECYYATWWIKFRTLHFRCYDPPVKRRQYEHHHHHYRD